jgi:hypothetical protein
MKIRYVAIATAAAIMAAAGLAHADQPGADWMPADQVIHKLTAKGYTNFGKVEADDGHWELEADLKGIRYDLHVDPKSGEITKSERDDD